MKKLSVLAAVLIFSFSAGVVWAVPSTYDFSVTVGTTHDTNVVLGSTYSFDFWWDILIHLHPVHLGLAFTSSIE